jgi:hypothetical protein
MFQSCFSAAPMRSTSAAFFSISAAGTICSKGGLGPGFSFGQMRWL